MDKCHTTLKKLLQSLQTDNKYCNQWPTLRSTCFSSRKSSFSSPMESNYSPKQFLVVHLWLSCFLMPLSVLWVSNLLNSLGEMRVRFSNDNHYWVTISKLSSPGPVSPEALGYPSEILSWRAVENVSVFFSAIWTMQKSLHTESSDGEGSIILYRDYLELPLSPIKWV